ncbi:MAG: thioesterase family protein [Phycisphaerales bacterium]
MTGAPEPTSSVPTHGSVRLRVRYAECDPFGVAHHSSYVPWLEEARTELLRDTGVTYAQLEKAGVFLVITKLDVKYRRPVRYDDLVEVRTRVVGGSKIKIRHEYEVALLERLGAPPDPEDPATPADGVCAIASTELACVDANGRPRALPAWLATR